MASLPLLFRPRQCAHCHNDLILNDDGLWIHQCDRHANVMFIDSLAGPMPTCLAFAPFPYRPGMLEGCVKTGIREALSRVRAVRDSDFHACPNCPATLRISQFFSGFPGYIFFVARWTPCEACFQTCPVYASVRDAAT